MTFSLLPLLFALLMVQFGFVAPAMGEPSELAGEALRRAVSGKTVHIGTPIGLFPIHYKSNGSMTGQAPMFVATLGGENDSGKLWVVDDRFCQRWQRWLDAKQYCFNFNVLAPPFIGRGMTV